MDSKPAFKIVIAYENLDAGIRARDMSARLAAGVRPGFELKSDLWKFDVLGHPQLRELAAREAAEADMIIISARGGAELPAQVKTWFEAWLPHKRGGMAALVALLGEEPETSSKSLPLCVWLRQRAEENGLDFFCNVDDRREADVEYTFETLHRRAVSTSVVLDGILQPRTPNPPELPEQAHSVAPTRDTAVSPNESPPQHGQT